MPRMVTVMVLPAGSAPLRTVKIDGDDYHQLNRLVGGNLGSCSLPPTLRRQDFYAFCDDDARVRADQPEPNQYAEHLGHFVLLGPVVIVKTNAEGETLSLRRRDVAALEIYFVQDPSQEARRAALQERLWFAAHPSGAAVMDASGQWQDL
jgi:hypothetical protein